MRNRSFSACCGYKPNVISTIVDKNGSKRLSGSGYKPNVISTIVDSEVNS